MLTAPMGRWMGTNTDDFLLLTGFSLLAIFLALKMWQQATAKQKSMAGTPINAELFAADKENSRSFCINSPMHLVGAGLTCGFVSGIFGVGFIIVPLLSVYAGIEIKRAVGTSLLVIALVSATGFAFHMLNVAGVPTDMLVRTSIGSIFGIVLGIYIAREMAEPKLEKLFACSVIGLMAISIYRSIL